MTGDT
jgi:hypothetical protein